MNFKSGQAVLVDTNVIIEAHRTGCLISLADFFSLETVEKCIEETQTGFQNRSPEENIDEQVLRSLFKVVHPVTAVDEAEFLIANANTGGLDPGERHLFVHALPRTDTWVLTSPDKAAVRFAHSKGQLDRVVSLEAMTRRISAHLSVPLRDNFSGSWLSKQRTIILLG